MIYKSAWMVGQNFSTGVANKDWGWPGYAFSIPPDWSSGAYIAMFHEGDRNESEISTPDVSTPDGRDAKALFVVKNAEPGKSTCILYKLPLFTYQAYDEPIAGDHGS